MRVTSMECDQPLDNLTHSGKKRLNQIVGKCWKTTGFQLEVHLETAQADDAAFANELDFSYEAPMPLVVPQRFILLKKQPLNMFKLINILRLDDFWQWDWQ